MNEPEAWREIARRIAARGEKCNYGLCSEVADLAETALVPEEIRNAMLARASAHAKLSPHRVEVFLGACFAYPAGTEAGARLLAALMFAEEAEDESGDAA